MSVLDRARKTARNAADVAAERGREVAGGAGRAAASGAAKAATKATDLGKDPETHDKARRALEGAGRQAKHAAGAARRGLVTVIERIEPGTLADVIIRATAIQEKANEALRRKGSRYRISEVVISASIPPGINFTIGRLDEGGDDAGRSSTELIGSESDVPVLSLDGAIDPEAIDPEAVDAGAIGAGERPES
jgi:hypothetical protein